MMIDKDDILLLLNEKWQCSIPFGWVPITGDQTIPDVEIYDSNIFENIIENVRLVIKNKIGINWLFEIREDGTFRKVDIEDCRFFYDGLEYIYTDSSLEIVLYFSHENTTTVGGKVLLEEINTWL